MFRLDLCCNMLDGTEQCKENKDEIRIVRSLDSLQQMEFYKPFHQQPPSDMTIVVGNRKYYLHKCVLEASSDVFEAMFSPSSVWEEAISKEAKLVENVICESVVPEFIKFMYSGYVHIKHDTALPLFILADKYNVEELINVCYSYMKHHMVLARRKNVLLGWYRFLQQSKHQDLAGKIHRFIRLNFSRFAQTEDFFQLEFEELLDFLEYSDLRVVDEAEVFYIVDRWMEVYCNECGHISENMFAKLTERIRFPVMSSSQLITLDSKSDLFRKLPQLLFRYYEIANVYQDCDIKTDLGLSSCKVFQPRLYFGNKYGVLRRFPLFTVGGNHFEETIRLMTSTEDLFSDETKKCVLRLTFNNKIARRMDITVNLLNGCQVGYNFDFTVIFYAKQDGDLYVYDFQKYHLGSCMGYKVIKDIGLLRNKLLSVDEQRKFLCGKNYDQLLLRFTVTKTPKTLKTIY